MKRSRLIPIALVAIFAQSSAQERTSNSQATMNAPKDRGLQITRSASVPVIGAIAGKAKCDSSGNIYVRVRGKDTANRVPSTLPVQKITPDGKIAGTFGLENLPADLRAIAFFVSADGTVSFAARSDSEADVYFVSFAQGAPTPKMVRLQTDFFIPYHLAVFQTGEILISGILGPENRSPYTAVFAPDGKMLRSIYEPEDEDARKRAETGEAGFRPENSEFGNAFAIRGDAALGSDGNVYLLRSTGLIYAISHDGKVVRKLNVQPPSPGLVADRLQSLPGQLAVAFLEKGMNKGIIEIVDYEGRVYNTHASEDSRMYAGHLGCSASEGFTFLGSDDANGLQIHKAELR